jgi:hypothetical protein
MKQQRDDAIVTQPPSQRRQRSNAFATSRATPLTGLGAWTSTRQVRWLLLLALLTVGSRLIFLAAFGGFDERLHDSLQDQNIYLDIARNLVAGRGFVVSNDMWVATPGKPTSIVTPLYPLFIAASFRVFGDSLIPLRLLQVLLALVVVVPVYVLGCRIFGQRAGAIAGTLVALYPPLVMYVRPIMSEALFFPLLALLLAVSAALDRPAPPRALLVLWGLLAGLAALVRTEAIFLAVVLLAYFAVRHWRSAGRRRLAPFVLALVTLGLTLLPYASYNYLAHGYFSPTPNKKWAFWEHTWWAEMRQHPEWEGVVLPERRLVPDWAGKTEAERDAYLGQLGLHFVYEHPGIYLVQRVKQLYQSYPLLPTEEILPRLGKGGGSARPDGYQYGSTSLDDSVRYRTPAEKVRVWAFRLAAVLAACGLLLLVRRRQREAYWLALIPLWNIVCVILFNGNERYRLQIDPYLILFSAVFLDRLWAWIRSTRKNYVSSPRTARSVVAPDI